MIHGERYSLVLFFTTESGVAPPSVKSALKQANRMSPFQHPPAIGILGVGGVARSFVSGRGSLAVTSIGLQGGFSGGRLNIGC